MTKEEIQKAIIFNDESLLIINKPCGIASHADKTEDLSIHSILEDHFSQKLFVTHRIDRPVSGIIIFTKNKSATTFINQNLKTNHISKTYLAAVRNRPKKDEDIITHELIHEPRIRKSIVNNKKTKYSKTSVLEYKNIGNTDHYTFLSIKPQTGRFHQIRAQLSAIGCPIKGDVKYGARRKNPDRSIHLHAFQMEFQHPVDHDQMRITAQLPNESLWNALGEINPLILHNNIERWSKKN